MYTLLPKIADAVAPLWDLLEEIFGRGQRTKRMVNNKIIEEEHWTLECKESWDASLGVLSDAVKLAYPK